MTEKLQLKPSKSIKQGYNVWGEWEGNLNKKITFLQSTAKKKGFKWVRKNTEHVDNEATESGRERLSRTSTKTL